MKKLLLSISIIVGLSLLASCGVEKEYKPDIKVNEKNVSLKVWVDLNQGDFYRKVVDDFKKEHPDKNYDITVIESESGRAQEYVQKDPEAAADVFITPNDRLGQLVESGAVYQLTKYTDDIKKNNTPTSIQAATYQDKMYGFPVTAEAMFMYYDKRVFSEDDIKTFSGITSKGKLGINLAEAGADYRETPWFIANGTYLYGENGEDPYGTTFNTPEGVQVLNWIGELKNNPNVVAVNADEISALRSGKINAVFSGVWNKDAMELADYITNADVQEKAFKELGKIPSNLEARTSSTVEKDDVAKAVIDMTSGKHSVLMPKIPEMNVFWQHMNPLLVDTYKGKIKKEDYPEALDKLVKDITPAK
ncbi:TPA: extracellular solute-binding protein [Listeria monocytogenes]|nr:extracellular solute-binding protein [Listeria monocytogenes]